MKHLRRSIQILLVSFLSNSLQAGNLNLSLPEVEFSSAPLKKNFDLTASFQDEAYSADTKTLNGYNNFAEVKARGKAQAKWSSAKVYLDIGGNSAANVTNYSGLYVPEAYVAYGGAGENTDEHVEWTIGRRFLNWNMLDSYWELGLWQPDYKWNYLHPVEQGLVGAFVDLHNDAWSVLAFASPLYIPEQGAPYSLSDGQIHSQSPWFIPPAKYVQLFSGLANIRYNLVMPNTSDIVEQFSAGVSLLYHPKPYYFKLSYVYKPRNSIALPVDGYLALHATGSDAPVFIYPKVIFHHLAGADLGYREKNFSLWVSALAEVLAKQDFDSSLTAQHLNNQTLFSPGLEWTPFAHLYSPQLGASFLAQSGGDVTETGALSNPNSNIFAYPLNYRSASEVRLAQPLLRGTEHVLDLKLKWIEEFRDKASLLYFELAYQYQLLNLYAGADLLGSAADSSNSGFIPRYRDNGFAYAGASLHF